MTIEEKIKEFNEKVEQMQEELKQQLQPAFVEMLNNLDRVQAYQWTQYTPYFNDGYPCEFSVDADIYIHFEGSHDFLDRWDLNYELKNGKRIYATVEESMKGEAYDLLEKFISSVPESIMKSLFGDHVQVTVTSNGLETARFEHD